MNTGEGKERVKMLLLLDSQGLMWVWVKDANVVLYLHASVVKREERNELSGSFSFPLTGQEEERRGGLKNRLQCWGSVRPLSCQKNEKEKRKIRLLWNSIFTQAHTRACSRHIHKNTRAAPTAFLLFIRMQVFTKYLYSCGFVIQDRGPLCPNLSFKFSMSLSGELSALRADCILMRGAGQINIFPLLLQSHAEEESSNLEDKAKSWCVTTQENFVDPVAGQFMVRVTAAPVFKHITVCFRQSIVIGLVHRI